MTDEEIVKALGLCAKDTTCLWDNECPLRTDKNCHTTLAREALKLIKKQNKEKGNGK